MSLIPEWLPRQDSTSEPARRLPAPQYLRGGRPPHPRDEDRGTTPAPPQRDDPAPTEQHPPVQGTARREQGTR